MIDNQEHEKAKRSISIITIEMLLFLRLKKEFMIKDIFPHSVRLLTFFLGVKTHIYFTLIFIDTVLTIPFFNVTFAFTTAVPDFWAVIFPFAETFATAFLDDV